MTKGYAAAFAAACGEVDQGAGDGGSGGDGHGGGSHHGVVEFAHRQCAYAEIDVAGF